MTQFSIHDRPEHEPPENPDEIRAEEEALAERRAEKPGYYYEHENGSIHWKPFIVVDMGGGPGEYFDSPMVKRWWKVEADD